MIDFSVIIVSFNTREYLYKCLSSIKQFTSENLNYEIIIVDNNSNDGSEKEFKNPKINFKNYKWIQNTENAGYSKANNIGVKAAKGKYLIFLNSDVELLQTNTFEKMVAFMEMHKNAGAATCFVELPNKTIDDASHRGFPTPWNAFCHFSGLGKLFANTKIFNGYHLGYQNLNKIHEIDALAGAFMIVRDNAGRDIGWWDEDYFFYGEDLQFCYDLKKIGWQIFFVPSVKILHHKGISGGIKSISENISKADRNTRINIQKARFAAMRIFYSKNYLHQYPRWLTGLVLKGVAFKEWLALRKY